MGNPYRKQIKQLTEQLNPYLDATMQWQSAAADRVGGVILNREENGFFAFQRRYDLQFLGRVGTEMLVEQYTYTGLGTIDAVLRGYVEAGEYAQNQGDRVLAMMIDAGTPCAVEPQDYQRLAAMLGQAPLANLQ